MPVSSSSILDDSVVQPKSQQTKLCQTIQRQLAKPHNPISQIQQIFLSTFTSAYTQFINPTEN